MQGDVKERLLAHKRAAAAQVEAVLAARDAGALDERELGRRLHAYVLAKLGLDPARAAGAGRDLEALAEASLARTAGADPSQAAEVDRSPTCDGARSVDMKQALLVMALQREFGVELDGLRAGMADTTDDLAALLFAALAGESPSARSNR